MNKAFPNENMARGESASRVEQTHRDSSTKSDGGDITQVGLRKERFDCMIHAIRLITEPLVNKEKFRVVIEKDPESDDVKFIYDFPE